MNKLEVGQKYWDTINNQQLTIMTIHQPSYTLDIAYDNEPHHYFIMDMYAFEKYVNRGSYILEKSNVEKFVDEL